MENKNVEKLKALPKGVVNELKQILKIIGDVLISHRHKPYINDFFEMHYFQDFKPLTVIRTLKALDDDFNIINFQQRETSKAVHIGLKTDEDATDFYNFQELVNEIYTGPEVIKKMTFVSPKETRFKAVINDDYSDWQNADKNIQYWRLLAEIALKGFAYKAEFKSAYDQLNNQDKNPFRNNYKHSQIIKSEKERITSIIEMEIINDHEFREQEKKLTS